MGYGNSHSGAHSIPAVISSQRQAVARVIARTTRLPRQPLGLRTCRNIQAAGNIGSTSRRILSNRRVSLQDYTTVLVAPGNWGSQDSPAIGFEG